MAVFNLYSVHDPANPVTNVCQEVRRLMWLKINTERPALSKKVAYHGQTVQRNMLLSLLLFSFSTQDVSLGLGEVPRAMVGVAVMESRQLTGAEPGTRRCVLNRGLTWFCQNDPGFQKCFSP